MMGEVHTGLLQHSAAFSPLATQQLLALVSGEQVRRSERPIEHAVSPDQLTGVDCFLNNAQGPRVRAVGTAVSRASITGGHVLQGSSYTRVALGLSGRRMPWSHYLAQPGTMETTGRFDDTAAMKGHLTGTFGDDMLNLGAISARAMESVQDSEALDRRAPFRSARTQLRWAISDTDAGASRLAFTIERDNVRTAQLPSRTLDILAVVELCEDLALHDWLLTTLLRMIERGQVGSGSRHKAIASLTPAIDHLLHLWMPAARLDETVTDLWESLELRPGFSRQWNACVGRIRDQLTLATMNLLAEGGSRGPLPPASATATMDR